MIPELQPATAPSQPLQSHAPKPNIQTAAVFEGVLADLILERARRTPVDTALPSDPEKPREIPATFPAADLADDQFSEMERGTGNGEMGKDSNLPETASDGFLLDFLGTLDPPAPVVPMSAPVAPLLTAEDGEKSQIIPTLSAPVPNDTAAIPPGIGAPSATLAARADANGQPVALPAASLEMPANPVPGQTAVAPAQGIAVLPLTDVQPGQAPAVRQPRADITLPSDSETPPAAATKPDTKGQPASVSAQPTLQFSLQGMVPNQAASDSPSSRRAKETPLPPAPMMPVESQAKPATNGPAEAISFKIPAPSTAGAGAEVGKSGSSSPSDIDADPPLEQPARQISAGVPTLSPAIPLPTNPTLPDAAVNPDSDQLPEVLFDRQPQPTASTPQQSARTETPPRAVLQIAQAAVALQDRPVELSLNPEELGRVRLTLHSNDATMSISITAERPESLDFLRRHIDLLAGQLRDLGYQKLSFAFAGQDGSFSNQSGQRNQDANIPDPALEKAGAPKAHRISLMPADGLDIRL